MKKKSPSGYVCLQAIIIFAASLSQIACAQSGTASNQLAPQFQTQSKTITTTQDEQQRAQLVDAFIKAKPEGATPFLLALLDSDSAPAIRRLIINAVGSRNEPNIIAALEKHAASDPDADVALLALNKLRLIRINETKKLLQQRLALAQSKGDAAEIAKLLEEQERWISITHTTTLPAFMRVPPPVFAVKPSNQAIRVLTLGDFGYGDEKNKLLAGAPQKNVAAAMLKLHKQKAFDFGVTLGDNFYSYGMYSPTDSRWQTMWSDLYDPLKVKFFATYGNHDWGNPDSPISELMFSQQSKSWVMPAPYYTFTAGAVQFFALDTNEVSDKQLAWLRTALAASTAQWKIVYGHHPIYSAGAHGNSATLIGKLLPVLKARVDIFLAGHDHDLQHQKAEGGIEFFINGGGGAGLREIKANERSLFALSSYGFATIEADTQKIVVKYFDTDLKELYQYTISKTAPKSLAATQSNEK